MTGDGATVNLISKEGGFFTVPLKVANMSQFVQSMMMDNVQEAGGNAYIFSFDPNASGSNTFNNNNTNNSPKEIHFPHVKAKVLKKVIEFCEHHLKEPMNEIEKPLKSYIIDDIVQGWYAKYVVDVKEQVSLHELILAAADMDIKPLLELSVASMITGKLPNEIRSAFNINSNDFFFFCPDNDDDKEEDEASMMMQQEEETKFCGEA